MYMYGIFAEVLKLTLFAIAETTRTRKCSCVRGFLLVPPKWYRQGGTAIRACSGHRVMLSERSRKKWVCLAGHFAKKACIRWEIIAPPSRCS